MNNIIPFNFNNNKIRTTIIDGNPYFCLVDACNALNIKQCRMDRMSNKGLIKNQLPSSGGKQDFYFINEPNLYRLIFRSNKPQAQAFADWVYSEVLPSIRKTGSYSVTDKPVTVAEHTRALPSGKKEIVLSERAKQEIGGIVKSVVTSVMECHPSHDAAHSCVKGSDLCETPNLFDTQQTAREELKALMREVIREEIADYNLKGGVKETEPHNNAPTANGLPIANWLVGISHAVGSINSIYEQMQKRQQSAVKLLTPSAKEVA